MDEPTTGVDAYSAQYIIRMLQTLAINGSTILCTIHQPSSEIFAMFDQVCILAGGRTAFMGKPAEVLPFLRNLNFICPELYNPADFCIRTVAIVPGKEKGSHENIKAICDYFDSTEAKNIETKIESEFELESSKELNVNSSVSWIVFKF